MKWQTVAILLCALLAACASSQKDAVRIGGVFHLSGDGAFWGMTEYNGATLAVEEINAAGGINGRPLFLIAEDGATDPKQSITAFQKLTSIDQVQAIVGPTWFGSIIAPMAEREHIVLLSPSTGATIPREKYFFNLWPTETQEIEPLVPHMQEHNHRTFAIVYDRNEYSTSVAKHFREQADIHGLTIVEEFAVPQGTEDFRSIIVKIKALGIDAIYTPFGFYRPQGQFSKQAQELELNRPMYATIDTENAALLETFPQIEGTIYPYTTLGPGEAAFNERYEQRFGTKPGPPAAYAYDAVLLLSQAMQSGAMTSEEIAAWLENAQDVPGVSNVITFENGRVQKKEFILKTVKNGTFVSLDERNQ